MKNNDNIEASENDYLYIALSGIPTAGKGLYTAIDIYKGEIIAYYQGEKLTLEEAAFRRAKDENAYFISLMDGTIMDSMHSNCFAKYANDPAGNINIGVKSNAVISIDEDELICLIAKRKINAGEEIFCSYGKKYWKNNFKLKV